MLKPFAPRGAARFQGPQTVTVPAANIAQQVVKTVFRAFSGTITPKSATSPLATLGFGTFTEQGNLVEKYVEISADMWKALIAAIHGGDIQTPATATFLPVTGGVQVAFLYPIVGTNGAVTAGSFSVFVPNALWTLLAMGGFAKAILTWADTNLWACSVQVGEKTFNVPMVNTVGGILFSNDPMALLSGV